MNEQQINRIFLEIAYDGGGYCGWQVQDNGNTVQAEIEKALAEIQKTHVRIKASGRTDAGVHARGQVAHFDSVHPTMPAEKYAPALNSLLPQDIRVLKSYAVAPDLHSRFSARMRVYHYYLQTGAQVKLPWEIPYCWTLRHEIGRASCRERV